MQNQSVLEYLKNLYKRSGAVGKLIAVSLVVHLLFGIAYGIERLFIHPELFTEFFDGYVMKFKAEWFAAPGNPSELVYKPWTIVTQLFGHAGILHLLFNMVALFFTARLFVQFFGERRLVSTYFLAGIFAYFFHITCYYTIPEFQAQAGVGLIGASGAVMGIFVAAAVHRPNLQVLLFGAIKLPLILIAGIYVLYNVATIFENDGVGRVAHLGGALFGAISVINVNSPKNFMNRFDKWLSKFKWPSFKRKPKMKVYKNDAKTMNDDEYNSNRQDYQKRVDAILDKISKKGYEGLSKEEKEILFNESKRK